MGTRTIRTDDINGTESTEASPVTPVQFSCSLFEGKTFEIDLTADNQAKLEKALTPYVIKARQVGRMRAASFANTNLNAQMRDWGKEQKNDDGSPKYDIAERGRLPRELIADYAAAHGTDNGDSPAE
jgi:hypothetical protein